MTGDRTVASPPLLDLPAAAEHLGVHYQTAYQWVRDGSIPAVRVRGRYQIDPAALDEFQQRREAPRPVVTRARPPAWERLAARLEGLLLVGDEVDARHQVLGLRDQGVPVIELMQGLLVPVLRSIGAGWASGAVSISQEHRATAIIDRLLGELMPNPPGRRRGRVVVAAVSGEQHGLPTSMAAAALREDRWNVEHLGNDVPTEEIERFVVAADADLVVLSVAEPARAAESRRLAERLTAAGVPAIVGQPGSTLDELIEAARRHAPAARRRAASTAADGG